MFYPTQEYAPIGSLKARYRPLGLVAQGQFGKVYCAVHRASGRLVALKLLDRQRSTTSQFLRELSSLLTLSHPALIQLRAIEQTDSGRCLVLDYSAGGTFRQLLEAPAPPRQELMLRCLLQVLEGLAYAHGRGIVHCDVKPENILMQLEPEGWRACLTDFGIAQSHLGGDVMDCDPQFERVGSPAYMAPERFAGEAYRASDLYSVGIMLYEVLLGDRPFHGSPNALREAHRQEAVKFSKPLEIAFQKLLYRALSKSPDLRYQSAKAMSLDLRHALETRGFQKSQGMTSACVALFSLPSQEAVLAWPEQSLASSASLSFELKFAGKPCLASISPLLVPIDASCEGVPRFVAGQPAETHSLARAELKPQLWLSHGRNLQGLSLNNFDSGALSLSQLPPFALPEAVQDLALTARYGFALTNRALYCWSLTPGDQGRAELSLDAVSAAAERSQWQCLLNHQSDLRQVFLSPQGHWAAIAKRCHRELAAKSPLSGADSLLLTQLSHQSEGSFRSRKDEVRELKLRPSETLMDVQLLDRRHGAALISSPGEPPRLGLFSRRGQWLSHFTLPVSLDYWVRGIPAYELWALEAGHPKVLLKLGLKPFRLERIPLAIAPEQIHPLPWGCVLFNQAGEILLLNREGQSLGQLQVPLPKDCQKLWLIILAPHCLVVVIQQAMGIKLLPLDLRQLELMLVF